MAFNIDGNLHGADWSKRTWDLGINNAHDFTAWLAVHHLTFAQFQQLPVYQANVGKLAWLRHYEQTYGSKSAVVDVVKFDPNQPRDSHGRFGEGDGESANESTAKVSTPSKPPGHSKGYHKFSVQGSTQEIQDALSKLHPDTQFDFKGVDPTNAYHAAVGLHAIMDRYPGMSEALTYVGTDPNMIEGYDMSSGVKDTAFATTMADPEEPASSMMWLNPKFFGDRDTMNTAVGACEWHSFHPEGTCTVEGIVTHEFGHVYQNYVEGANGGGSAAFSDTVKESSMFGAVMPTFNLWKECNYEGAGNVSGYAEDAMLNSNGGDGEAWAEAFASANLTTSKYQVGYTKNASALLGTLGKPSDWSPASEKTWTQTATPDMIALAENMGIPKDKL